MTALKSAPLPARWMRKMLLRIQAGVAPAGLLPVQRQIPALKLAIPWMVRLYSPLERTWIDGLMTTCLQGTQLIGRS